MASMPFKFVVGPNRREFFVHTNALTEISPVLRALIAGSMNEAIEGTAVLADINEDDFARLCEYAYSRDYRVPVPDSDPPELPVRPEGSAEPQYRYSHWRKPLIDLFDTHKETTIRSLAKEYGQSPGFFINRPRYNSNLGSKDWTETLLQHANMYVIADRYDVAGLRPLACFYLHDILYSIFKDTWDSIPAIEKLVRLTYENTESPDDLRGLVSGYVALKSESMFLHPNMQTLRDECHDFCSDVLKSVTKRLDNETAV
ncbi:hypothetical protein F5B19DRAFT_84604 [Rostrohypoxylon terebratum]|nr:hypothetical protein F5B19DRAFT_84604 [Rostrohypoxylon terebratum]